MPYREDLEAALAHAESLERDLDAARAENAVDRERIAELEKKLAEAKKGVHEARKSAAPKTETPSEEKRTPEQKAAARERQGRAQMIAFVAVLLITGVGAAILSLRPFDPRTIDVTGYLAKARSEARKDLPDAVLSSIRADYVDPRGVSDLSYGGKVRYSFVSPSQAATPAAPTSGPIGAPKKPANDPTCAMDVNWSKRRGLTTSPTSGRGDPCGEAIPDPPSCSVVDVWNEAIRRGAPRNALATLRLRMSSYRPPNAKSYRAAVWEMNISDENASKTVFSMDLLDRCPVPKSP